MHSPYVREEVLALIAQGINDCEIARRTGLPRGTIRDWRHQLTRPRPRQVPLEMCLRCWRGTKPLRFTPSDYTELLGLYLGDGCISEGARTARLRVTLDTKYPGIIEDLRALLLRCFPHNSVGITRKTGQACVAVWVYSQHLACLFPQHGSGRKHAREISLESWQRALVRAAPWPLLRGLVRSDGCAFINRTGPYEYLSYDFTNVSKDIVDIFTATCDLVGVEYRVTGYRGKWRVRINRRASVALMEEQVGLKT